MDKISIGLAVDELLANDVKPSEIRLEDNELIILNDNRWEGDFSLGSIVNGMISIKALERWGIPV